ncbi:hypothetical protein [Pseudomonas syringae]|nr:hypothetical protein [Pseudomonas syringae]
MKTLPKRLGSVAQRFVQSFGTQRSIVAQRRGLPVLNRLNLCSEPT